jgi:hypothetical protein
MGNLAVYANLMKFRNNVSENCLLANTANHCNIDNYLKDEWSTAPTNPPFEACIPMIGWESRLASLCLSDPAPMRRHAGHATGTDSFR